jgi:dTDP-4-dehydrorhamnose reductase
MIAITGVTGLLGSTFMREALHAGHAATGFYHSMPIRIKGAQADGIELKDPASVLHAVSRARPQWIVHCAAATDVDWCQSNPTAAKEVNTSGTASVVRAARSVGARVAYISTDSVFDGEHAPYAETVVTAPLNVYARTKLAGEEELEPENGDMVVRTSIYGKTAIGKQSLSEYFLARLQAGEPAPGFTDVMFTPILAARLSNVLLALMKKDASGLFHVGCADACSKYDFGLRIAAEFGLNGELVRPVSIKQAQFVAPRPRNTALRTEKISAFLGMPMPTLAQDLREYRRMEEASEQLLKSVKR